MACRMLPCISSLNSMTLATARNPPLPASARRCIARWHHVRAALTPRSPPSRPPRGTARRRRRRPIPWRCPRPRCGCSPSTQGHMIMVEGATLVDPAGVVAGARDDVHVASSRALGGVAHALDAASGRRSPDRNGRPPRPRSRRRAPRRSFGASASMLRVACASSLACSGERMSTVNTTLPGSTLRELGENFIWPTPPTAPGWSLHRDRLHHLEDARHGEPGIDAHVHRRRAGMRFLAGQREFAATTGPGRG